jgi:ABC-type enterochelin transport system ATPase subunit
MVARANGPKFLIGRLVATPGALGALGKAKQGVLALIARHVKGDWGEVCAEDAKANDWSVENEARILSAYTLPNGVKVWIITEADRSSTCVLLPEEY